MDELTTTELEWKERAEAKLIEVYVPEAEFLTREDALALAIERDRAAAQALIDSVNSTLDLEAALRIAQNKTVTGREESPRVKVILQELGY